LRLGTVYLLHFNRPYHHARHYVGFTTNIERRVKRHQDGRGSPLIEAAISAGIEFTVARLWNNVTGRFERRIHEMEARLLCPMCVGPEKMRPATPRISDYQEDAYEEYPENLEYDGHWEYQPLRKPWRQDPREPWSALRDPWQEHPGSAEVIGEPRAELLGKDGLLATGLEPEAEQYEHKTQG
jgi:predicted GIY-YIG superfamily endonuclease